MENFMRPLGALAPLKRAEKKPEQPAAASPMRPPVLAPLPSGGPYRHESAYGALPAEAELPCVPAETESPVLQAEPPRETPEGTEKISVAEPVSAVSEPEREEEENVQFDMPLFPPPVSEPERTEEAKFAIPEEIAALPDAIDTDVMPEPYTIPLMESITGKYRGKRRESK